jgi:SSS family solute:Na+ symporter/sodium/proline symporter
MAIGVIVLESLIALLGIVGRGLYPDLEQPQQVIPWAIRHALEPAAGALVLAATVAVVVSTADSFLLVPATNVVRDVYQRFLAPRASERSVLVVSRLVVVLLGVVAYVQVRYWESILEMALYAYTVYGAAITPAVLAAFFWKRVRPLGGAASIATGMVTTLVWETIVKPRDLHVWTFAGSTHSIDSVYPALAASLTTLVLLSLLRDDKGQGRLTAR